jgi:hypothetical protein
MRNYQHSVFTDFVTCNKVIDKANYDATVGVDFCFVCYRHLITILEFIQQFILEIRGIFIWKIVVGPMFSFFDSSYECTAAWIA